MNEHRSTLPPRHRARIAIRVAWALAASAGCGFHSTTLAAPVPEPGSSLVVDSSAPDSKDGDGATKTDVPAAAAAPGFGNTTPASRAAADEGHRRMSVLAALPTEEEWAEVGDFMLEHSRARWELAQQSLSQPGRSELPRRLIFSQYLELKKLETSDPAEFKQRVGQIELEDQIFQAESLLRNAEVKQSADVSDLRTAFELKVKEHLERELDAKEARIGRLETQLRQQRAALEAERQKESQTLQQRIEIARRLSDWFRSWASGTLRRPFPLRGNKSDDETPKPDDSPPANETKTR